MADCHVNTSFGPSPGAHSLQCTGTGKGLAGAVYGMRSAPFEFVGGSYYAWTATVRTEQGGYLVGSTLNLDIIGEGAPSNQDTSAGSPVGHASLGKWQVLSGTWIAPQDNGSAYVFFFNEGPGNQSWWLADVQLLRLSSALVNVIRTETTDVTVRDQSTGLQYELGRDYTIANASMRNENNEGTNLIKVWSATAADGSHPGRYTIHRLPGGRLTTGQRVLVSYDFLGGLIGYIGDGAHLNSFAEPRW